MHMTQNDNAKKDNQRHASVMQALANEHEVLLGLIDGRPFHYVDIPVHGNIGDLLIMQGTLAFFSKHGIRPRITAPAFAYDADWIRDDDVIMFHGGGNFGDLYAAYGMQETREHIVATRPDNRIIVLPQTIHFSSDAERKRSAKIFRQHPDVHLCVRDAASHAIALEFTDHVYLLPDMAHQLYRLSGVTAANPVGNLRISRTDDEAHNAPVTINEHALTTTDWPALLGDRERHIETFRKVMRKSHKLGLTRVANRLLMDSWARYTQTLVSKAIELFASHEHIFTDRLHGHILACLMDKPNTVIDNSYGKNSTYVTAWTGYSDLVSVQQN
jgi:pyruvyl transferase EpsO